MDMTKDVVSIIESDDIAFDILLGNTPSDMIYRAYQNETIQDLADEVKSDPTLVEKIIIGFDNYLEDDHQDLGSTGKVIAYLAILSQSESTEALSKIEEFGQTIKNNSLIFEVFKIAYKKIQNKLSSSIDLTESDDFKKFIMTTGSIFSMGTNIAPMETVRVGTVKKLPDTSQTYEGSDSMESDKNIEVVI